jgi:hypothetical protein
MPERDRYVIALGLFPSDPSFGMELQRAPDDGSGSAPNTGAAETIEEMDGLRRVFVDVLPNDNAPRYYRWRHIREGWTAGAWTAWVRGVPTRQPDGKRIPDTPPDVLPQFTTRVDEPSANMGRMTVAIVDPQNRVRTVEFRIKSGGAAWGSWGAAGSPTTVGEAKEYATTVALADGDFSRIEARVGYYDERPKLVAWQRESGAMDPGAFPNVVTLIPEIASDGACTARVEGDTDTLSLKVVVRTDREPTLAEVRAGTLINAASGTTGTLASIPVGGKAYAGALAYSGASATGLESAAVYRTATRNADVPAPSISGIIQDPSGAPTDYMDVYFTVSSPAATGGTLSVWTNPGAHTSANPSGAADGSFAITAGMLPYAAGPATLFTTSGGTANLLNDVPTTIIRTKHIYVEFVDASGRTTGKIQIAMAINLDKVFGEDGTLDPEAPTTAGDTLQELMRRHAGHQTGGGDWTERERAAGEGFGGVPGTPMFTHTVLDSAGLQPLLDTSTRRMGSALLLPGGTASGTAETYANRVPTLATADGVLNNTVQASDGTSAGGLPKKVVEGQAWNGLLQTFAAPYTDAPATMYQPRMFMSERAIWGTQSQADANSGNGSGANAKPTGVDFHTLYTSEVTPSTILHRLYLMATGTRTPKSATFASPTSVSIIGNSTGTAFVPSADGPAFDNRYTIAFSITATDETLTAQSGTIVVSATLAVDGGAQAEVASASIPYSVPAGGTDVIAGSFEVFTSQISGADDLFRLKLKSRTGLATVTLSVAASALTWQTDTGAKFASMTPNGSVDAVKFLLLAKS